MFILIIHRGNIFTQVKMTWTRCCEAGELAVAKSAKSAKFTVYFFCYGYGRCYGRFYAILLWVNLITTSLLTATEPWNHG
jgi:hypothetical protein